MNFIVVIVFIIVPICQAAPHLPKLNLTPGQEAELVRCILDAVSQIVNSSISIVPGLDSPAASDILGGAIQIGGAIITNLPTGDIAGAGSEILQGALQMASGAASAISLSRITSAVNGILTAVEQIVGAAKSQEILQQCSARISG